MTPVFMCRLKRVGDLAGDGERFVRRDAATFVGSGFS
jgi:hypothetical protein